MDSSTITLWIDTFPIKGLPESFLLLPCFIEIHIHVLNANNADPNQTPRSAAFDLGLHCLPMSF